MNSAIAPQKLGLLLFFFIFLFLFQERRSSQPFLFLFFFGAEGRVRIGGPAGISLPLGECSVAIGLLLVICVFTFRTRSAQRFGPRSVSLKKWIVDALSPGLSSG